jgi:hypothetical protein
LGWPFRLLRGPRRVPLGGRVEPALPTRLTRSTGALRERRRRIDACPRPQT